MASSLEDKQRYIHQGNEYRVGGEADARAKATTLEQAAAAAANDLLQTARGETSAFLELRDALKNNPMATRLRMQLQTLERLLGGKKLVLVLDPGRTVVPMPATNAASRGSTAPLFNNSRPAPGQENN